MACLSELNRCLGNDLVVRLVYVHANDYWKLRCKRPRCQRFYDCQHFHIVFKNYIPVGMAAICFICVRPDVSDVQNLRRRGGVTDTEVPFWLWVLLGFV
jgi:hypothetical protein